MSRGAYEANGAACNALVARVQRNGAAEDGVGSAEAQHRVTDRARRIELTEPHVQLAHVRHGVVVPAGRRAIVGRDTRLVHVPAIDGGHVTRELKRERRSALL